MSSNVSSLFLQSIVANGSSSPGSGSVTFTLPMSDGSHNANIFTAWLAENPTFKLGNNWQATMPSMDSVTKFSNIVDTDASVISWLAGAQSAWMGVEPLTIALTFYLFSMDPNSNIKSKEFMLGSLCTPYQKGGSQDVTAIVHGGYKPDILSDTSTNSKYTNMDESAGLNRGLITVKIGHQITFTQMLLVDITPEHSALEVADGNPLYIKFNASFKTYRPITSDEFASILGVQQ